MYGSTPDPIPASYVPTTSAVKLPADAPIQDILAVMERDGGLILTNLVSADDLAAIEDELEPYTKATTASLENAPVKEELAFFSERTRVIPGLVGKSQTIAKICEHPALEGLRNGILLEKFGVTWEDGPKEFSIEPLLSLSATFDIGYGAPRQRLHRDDYTHAARHGGKFDLTKAGQFTVMIAATETTRENGATMFIPGSHKWDDSRMATPDEVCFAEMEPGSAFVFLASCYHGGGHNSVLGTLRKCHGLFFIRGNMRQEENQFLAVPRSRVLTMSDKMLHLLGYKLSGTLLGIVNTQDPSLNLAEVFQASNA